MSCKPLFGEGRIRAADEKAEGQSRSASWAGSSLVFDNRQWACREAELRWASPHHLFVLTERGGTRHTSVRSDTKPVYDGMDRPGVITFVPAGTERQGFYRDVDLSYSALWIAPDLRIPGCDRLRDLPTLVNREDAVTATLLNSLRAEIALGHMPDTAYVEHVVALSSLRFAALNRDRVPAERSVPLSRRTFARVREYIDAHVDSDVSLTDLAAVANMGVDAFARRFKSTTGLAPYAYVIEERARRAEALLRETDMAMGVIAVRLGFSSQSHFTSTFRRVRGMTPRAYRTHFSPDS